MPSVEVVDGLPEGCRFVGTEVVAQGTDPAAMVALFDDGFEEVTTKSIILRTLQK